MVFIAVAFFVVLAIFWLGDFPHWFSNSVTHSIAVPKIVKLHVPKQESGGQRNEVESNSPKPLYGHVSGQDWNMEAAFSGENSAGNIAALIAKFKQALATDPNDCEAHFFLAMALSKAGRPSEAIFHYSETVHLDDSCHIALNNIAWIRATSPDPNLRDGSEALRLAKRACELNGKRDYNYLETLAVCYAETQQFSKAVSTAEEAVALAKAANQQAAANEIQSRLALFRAGIPYRETPRPAADAVPSAPAVRGP